ncbi:MAG TPA: cysteine desulfurase [Alphaproteobacteria bacterium]|nr:cysteine desulfurase [Alphaproteobacteria bacterium]
MTAIRERVAEANYYDVEAVRRDFPILSRMVHGKPLIFLDSAASAQKPRAVIDAVTSCYSEEYANIHRGVYFLSQLATEKFEGARKTVQCFLNAGEAREIVFTRSATEAINLVASSYGRHFLKRGDEIILSEIEHHSNIVPWQLLRDETGVVLRIAAVDDRGALRPDHFRSLLSERTKLVAVTHMSNALGTVLPVRELTRMAHEAGARVLIDGCQAVPHMPVDVRAIDADFYVFSGHKLYGPSGIGVLYAKADLLESMPPYQGGGDMILSVSFEKSTYAPIPHKFEAGTPHIAGAIGLGAAIDYVTSVGLNRISNHEHALTTYASERLMAIPGIALVGTAPGKGSILSFVVDGVHPHDVGTILDHHGIAVRAGHHCAQPAMDRFKVPGTVRASLGMYNTEAEVDTLAAALRRVREIFA